MEEYDELIDDAGAETEEGDGAVWIDTVFADLEAAHYSCGAIILPASGVGAPHIRLRTWFVAERSAAVVADSLSSGLEGHGRSREVSVSEGRQGEERHSSEASRANGLDNSNGRGCRERELGDEAGQERSPSSGRSQRDEGSGRDDVADAVGGDRLANAEHAERWKVGVNGEDGRDRQDCGRTETHGILGARSEVLGVANAEDIRHERSGGPRGRRDGYAHGGADERLANTQSIEHQRDSEILRKGGEWEGAARGDDSSSGLAHSTTDGRGEERSISGRIGEGDESKGRAAGLDAGSLLGRLDDSAGPRCIGEIRGAEANPRNEARLRGPGSGREEIGVANPNGGNAGAEREQRGRQQRQQPQDDLFGGEGYSGIGHNGGPGLQGTDPTDGFWRNPDWLFCRDGKWRPIESEASALAHGLPRGMGALSAELRGLAEMAGLDGKSLARAKKYRVGSLKGYGNAIVVEAAVEVIRAYMEYADDPENL